MDKKISYEARDYSAIKEELIKFSNQYYPELADSYDDSSVGSWFIDLCAVVGDSLNYSLDRALQETNLNSATMKSTVNNIARMNGLKIPGAKPSMCEIEVSCELKANGNAPDWDYAPILKRGSVFSAGNYSFEVTGDEGDINFDEQFNMNGYSNRRIIPSRDNNGNVTGYTVSKTVVVQNGKSKIYSKVLTDKDIKPFMDIILPEVNVLNVESIIFKETSNYGNMPAMSEFYIDSEVYQTAKDSVMTYRYFEVDSLADQYRFGTTMVETEKGSKVISDWSSPYDYEDYTEGSRTTRYYKGQWVGLTQKYITEFTDNGYLKIVFGAGNGYFDDDAAGTTYGNYVMSKIMNNDMLGVIPQAGWTMFILYRVGGGYSTNLGIGAINNISNANVEFKADATDGTVKGNVIRSLKVTNISPGVAGKDAPSTEEIKNLIKYNNGAMNRCVTVKDYKSRVMMMPAKFGSPFRCQVAEANNKIEMSFLGLNGEGKLDATLPQLLVDNICTYMENYKTIGDYIMIQSGKIYNLGVLVELFLDKSYNTSDVVKEVIGVIQNYFDVSRHDMGDDIFIGDLQKTIMQVDGVMGIIKLEIYNIYNANYSPDISPLPTTDGESSCNVNQSVFNTAGNATSAQIDLNATEMVLYGDYNSMYEIKYPENDIQIKVKLI